MSFFKKKSPNQQLTSGILVGDLGRVEQAIQAGAELDGINPYFSPLFLALARPNYKIIETLLKHGANPNLTISYPHSLNIPYALINANSFSLLNLIILKSLTDAQYYPYINLFVNSGANIKQCAVITICKPNENENTIKINTLEYAMALNNLEAVAELKKFDSQRLSFLLAMTHH